jgi:hypothetical protein
MKFLLCIIVLLFGTPSPADSPSLVLWPPLPQVAKPCAARTDDVVAVRVPAKLAFMHGDAQSREASFTVWTRPQAR